MVFLQLHYFRTKGFYNYKIFKKQINKANKCFLINLFNSISFSINLFSKQ